MRRALWITALAAVAGCTHSVQRVYPHEGPFPASLALLPLNNLSNNLQAPILVRKLLEARLRGAGFITTEAKAVDELLKGVGVTDGGQLAAVQPGKLGEVLGAQALLYGEVAKFGYTTLGVYNRRIVEVHLILVDAVTGQKWWESTRADSHTAVGLDRDEIRRNLAVGLVEKYAETILKSPLRPEAEAVSEALLQDLVRVRQAW